MTRRLRVDPYLLLLLVLSLPALAPLLAPGYFYDAHDGRHSVFYLIQFDASLRDGAWWPRWAMHHIQGLGYPTFLIQAPLGLYLGELFVLLGASFTQAARLSWATGVLAGAWGMYALVRHWLTPRTRRADYADDPRTRRADYAEDPRKRRADYAEEPTPAHASLAALAAGVLYVYFPYHIADLYVRGALNDSLLLGWLPWLFLGFDRLLLGGWGAGRQRRLAVAMLLLAGTLLTHTFALLSIVPLLVSFVLFRLIQAWWVAARAARPGAAAVAAGRFRGGHLLRALPWQQTLLALAGGLGGLLLCAIFLLPLLAEGRYLQQQVYVTDTYDFRNHFVQLGQYFSPFWGFGYSDDPLGANDGMSFQVGSLLLVLAIAGASQLLLGPQTSSSAPPVRQTEQTRTSALQQMAVQGYLLLAAAVLLVGMTPLAQPLWEVLTPLAVIQFPWRLLALAGFLLSGQAGIALAALAADRGAVQSGTRSPAHPLILSKATSAHSPLLIFALLAVFASWPYLQANLSPVEPWREDGRAIFRFEQEHPDMIAYTEWVTQPFTTTAMSAGYAAPDYREDHGYTTSLQRLEIAAGEGQVLSNWSRGSSGGGEVEMATAGVVQVNEFYFPGWRVHVDGLPVEVRPSPTGAILVDVPAGRHTVEARFGDTPPRTLGLALSGAMLLVALALLAWPGARK